MTPIDPASLTSGAEWNVGGVGGIGDAAGGAAETGQAGGTGFGTMLGDQLGKLEQLQTSAAGASRALADGTATDSTAAVMAVERAQLAMQLASQLRTKGVEAVQELLHTQV